MRYHTGYPRFGLTVEESTELTLSTPVRNHGGLVYQIMTDLILSPQDY